MRLTKVCKLCGHDYKAGLFDDPNLCRTCAALDNTFSAGPSCSDAGRLGNGPPDNFPAGETKLTDTNLNPIPHGCSTSSLGTPGREDSQPMQSVHQRMAQRSRQRARGGRAWFKMATGKAQNG